MSAEPFDMNQAVAVLSAMHHWTVKTVNGNGQRKAHECTIWNDGRRVTGQGRTPVAAVCRALSKLRTPKLKSGKQSRAKSATSNARAGSSLSIASFAE